MANDKCYSVRCWDSFYNTYTMIPISNLSFKDAVTTARGIAVFHDTMEDGTEEMQVWVDTPTLGTAQMVGYLSYEPDDPASDDFGFVYCHLF